MGESILLKCIRGVQDGLLFEVRYDDFRKAISIGNAWPQDISFYRVIKWRYIWEQKLIDLSQE